MDFEEAKNELMDNLGELDPEDRSEEMNGLRGYLNTLLFSVEKQIAASPFLNDEYGPELKCPRCWNGITGKPQYCSECGQRLTYIYN